jgi:hypothetical protein
MLINKISDVIMSGDDASFLVTANSQDEILQGFNDVSNHMSKLFQVKWLNLNPTKTKYLKFPSAGVPNFIKSNLY